VFYAQFTGSIDQTHASPDTYYSQPEYYITDLGANAGSPGEVYQIDAVGYGGTLNTVAVVESTYLITSGTAKDPSK
jgi:Tfp pilus assembly protein PilX